MLEKMMKQLKNSDPNKNREAALYIRDFGFVDFVTREMLTEFMETQNPCLVNKIIKRIYAQCAV